MKFRWFWQKLDYIILALLVVGFFIASSLFNYYTQEPGYVKFLSPDETANYYFARHYAESGVISVFEPANLIAEEVVQPRSLRSDHGWLKPVSFLGIILLYGKIASVLGIGVIPYLTPLFASFGLLFFYGFVRKLFGRQPAIIAASLLAAFPVYFFYTTRSMFHNIIFTFFLLGGSFFLVHSVGPKENEKTRFLKFKLKASQWWSFLFAFLAGIFFGGAAGARSSELLWLAPVLFIAWMFYARRLGVTRLVLMASGIFLALLPIFYWNQVLYSSPFYGGYGEMNQSISQITQAGGNLVQSAVKANFSQYRAAGEIIMQNIFYFGYQPYQSLKMFYYYVVVMFPTLVGLAFLGGIIFLTRLRRKSIRPALLYIISWVVLSTILVFYYGSWKFNDNPDPSRFTIGNSYTRYWLPMYIMALPFAALAISYFARLLSSIVRLKPGVGWRARSRRLIADGSALMMTAAVMFFFFIFTFFGSEEGLINLYYNHAIDKANAEAVLDITPENAIIMTQYHDKQLFPERKVINALLTNDTVNASVGKILAHYPIYYFNFAFPEKDLIYLNERRLPNFGFTLELLMRRGRFGLYELKAIEEAAVE